MVQTGPQQVQNVDFKGKGPFGLWSKANLQTFGPVLRGFERFSKGPKGRWTDSTKKAMFPSKPVQNLFEDSLNLSTGPRTGFEGNPYVGLD